MIFRLGGLGVTCESAQLPSPVDSDVLTAIKLGQRQNGPCLEMFYEPFLNHWYWYLSDKSYLISYILKLYLILYHIVMHQEQIEFWFFFLHILNGRMATLPQALPRSFRDLHFCFRESKFKTAASASFRGVDFFRIFLEVLPRSHGELPRKLYLGVAWKCVICI